MPFPSLKRHVDCGVGIAKLGLDRLNVTDQFAPNSLISNQSQVDRYVFERSGDAGIEQMSGGPNVG